MLIGVSEPTYQKPEEYYFRLFTSKIDEEM